MVLYKILFLIFASGSVVLGQFRHLPWVGEGRAFGPCDPKPGPVGDPGTPGEPGYPGSKGIKGDPVASTFSRPPKGTKCHCPIGPKGEEGEPGFLGAEGLAGVPGYPGPMGSRGYQGIPGPQGMQGAPAPPLPRYPPNNPDTMFIPVMFNAGRLPRVLCQHVRRQAFVPGAPQKWLGWYEIGRSGYLTFDKWLYFSSRFQCPCSVPLPPGPTPSPEKLLRLL